MDGRKKKRIKGVGFVHGVPGLVIPDLAIIHVEIVEMVGENTFDGWRERTPVESRRGEHLATAHFNEDGSDASKLPQDKPVVCRIKTNAGQMNYVGIAKGGRVPERILDRLASGNMPGAKVEIQQKPSIQGARETEKLVIARSQPK